MGYPKRCRDPEIWQHVMIRGVAQRSICDRDRDARSFFDRVGGSVDRGEIRVAAYCLMPNHAHLIVRGPAGGLGDAMRNIASVVMRRPASLSAMPKARS